MITIRNLVNCFFILFVLCIQMGCAQEEPQVKSVTIRSYSDTLVQSENLRTELMMEFNEQGDTLVHEYTRMDGELTTIVIDKVDHKGNIKIKRRIENSGRDTLSSFKSGWEKFYDEKGKLMKCSFYGGGRVFPEEYLIEEINGESFQNLEHYIEAAHYFINGEGTVERIKYIYTHTLNIYHPDLRNLREIRIEEERVYKSSDRFTIERKLFYNSLSTPYCIDFYNENLVLSRRSLYDSTNTLEVEFYRDGEIIKRGRSSAEWNKYPNSYSKWNEVPFFLFESREQTYYGFKLTHIYFNPYYFTDRDYTIIERDTHGESDTLEGSTYTYNHNMIITKYTSQNEYETYEKINFEIKISDVIKKSRLPMNWSFLDQTRKQRFYGWRVADFEKHDDQLVINYKNFEEYDTIDIKEIYHVLEDTLLLQTNVRDGKSDNYEYDTEGRVVRVERSISNVDIETYTYSKDGELTKQFRYSQHGTNDTLCYFARYQLNEGDSSCTVTEQLFPWDYQNQSRKEIKCFDNNDSIVMQTEYITRGTVILKNEQINTRRNDGILLESKLSKYRKNRNSNIWKKGDVIVDSYKYIGDQLTKHIHTEYWPNNNPYIEEYQYVYNDRGLLDRIENYYKGRHEGSTFYKYTYF